MNSNRRECGLRHKEPWLFTFKHSCHRAVAAVCGGRGVVAAGLKLKVGWFGKDKRMEIIEFFY